MRALFLVAALAPAVARGNAALWFDPDLGCGRVEVYAQTGQLADLPGCSGTLPPRAPEMEQALRDAKRDLLAAEANVTSGNIALAMPLLDAVERRIARTPPGNPELPDRWSRARPLYERAVADLRARARLASRFGKLSTAYRAAVDAAAVMTARERDGGAADALAKARDCVAEFAEARAGGVDLSVEAELVPGRRRPLAEALDECDRAQRAAEPLARAEDAALAARRAEVRKPLRGDRLRIFDAHPRELPAVAGVRRATARAIGSAPAWRYARDIFYFRGNKLLRAETR